MLSLPHPPFPLPQDENEWPPFFHMPVLMLMLITVLNDGTLIAIGYVTLLVLTHDTVYFIFYLP
jgi:hypothetical protein